MAKQESKKTVKESKVLTQEDRILYALERQQNEYCFTVANKNYTLLPDVPLSRYLKIGDNVEVGNLDDCVVVYITPDQKFVVVDYTQTENNYGNPVITPHCIGCWAWFDVLPISTIQQTSLMKEGYSIMNRLTTSSLRGLLSKVTFFGVKDDPEFQRDYVWNEQDEVNLIDSVFNDRDIGKFVFLKYPWPRTDLDILDGKQRLHTLIRFTTSMFSYNGYYWHQLGRLDRHKFEDISIQYAEIDATKFSEADKLQLFLNANVAGVPQSEEHLRKVKQRLKELTD